ncbi:MAG: deoxyribonuclease IV [Candidatus Zixiibacteriota bacterium]
MLFGAHESIAGGVDKAIERGKQATCDTIQMFNKSNSQWRAATLKPEEIERYSALQKELKISVSTSHASYLINIASPDKALADKSVAALKEEMERCEVLKIPNLVLHPGAHMREGVEKGIARVIASLNRLFDSLQNNNVTLLLETTAGQGSVLGSTFEEIAAMIQGAEASEKVGVCLDTCHIFAAGYPISDSGDYKKTIQQFDDAVGIDKLRIIHMNDSKKGLGSHVDRHEHIGKGEIGLDGFRNIVNDKRLAHIPMILETPKEEELLEDIENLKVLRGLVAKKK